MKKIILECGGKIPAVVLSDATNLDGVAEHAVFAALWNMGQNCTANSRLIVHKNLKDKMLSKVKEKMADWHTATHWIQKISLERLSHVSSMIRF